LADIREQVISMIESEIAERQSILALLRGNGTTNGNGHIKAATRSSPSNRRWTPERRKKFMATLRRRRKEEAA
jgi:hypothetical protein